MQAPVALPVALKDLIDLIARGLVDCPEEVSVRVSEDDQATVYELQVARDDLGKVIGKEGKTARAIRTLLVAAGAKRSKRIVFEILG